MSSRALYTIVILFTLFSISNAFCAPVRNKKTRVWRPDNCNSSTLDNDIQSHLKSPITVIVVPTVYAAVLLVGLPANGIAFWVLVFKSKKMPSTLLLINLAAADLFFMLALPFKIAYHYLGNNWIFGETMCQIVTAVFYGNMYCSVFFLMAISIDRYFGLVHPFLARSKRGWRSSASISTGIWLFVIAGVSIFFIVPQSKTFSNPSMTTCHEVWATCNGYDWYTKYFLVLFAVGFAIPSIVIFICYVAIWITLWKNREAHSQVFRLTILVVVMFILCFTPSNILLILHYLATSWDCHNQLYMWYMVALCLTSFNSCIDPFIYYYISADFRTVVQDSLSWGSSANSESVECTKKKLTSEMGRISP